MTATTKKTRSYKQQLASLLQKREWRGCHGQITRWLNETAIELFAPDTPEMRERFPRAERNAQGTLMVGYVTLS